MNARVRRILGSSRNDQQDIDILGTKQTRNSGQHYCQESVYTRSPNNSAVQLGKRPSEEVDERMDG